MLGLDRSLLWFDLHTATSTQTTVGCPICGAIAHGVHSRYTRHLADLPCRRQRVCLRVLVRKFFCEIPTCARKIFTERLTSLAHLWARFARLLFQSVQIIGLATGGRLGVRVMQRLGIPASRSTILQRIMALPFRPIELVSELEIDDFSFRRGRKFGTILVDLQAHQVVDLLPDRTAETAAAWVSDHPVIDLVSRGRSQEHPMKGQALEERGLPAAFLATIDRRYTCWWEQCGDLIG